MAAPVATQIAEILAFVRHGVPLSQFPKEFTGDRPIVSGSVRVWRVSDDRLVPARGRGHLASTEPISELPDCTQKLQGPERTLRVSVTELCSPLCGRVGN